jgi:hypothetical protein
MDRFSRRRLVVLSAGTVLTLLTGCSGTTSTGVSSPAPTTLAVSTTISTPITTSVAKPGLPTYSEVVATYPAGVDKCDSVANLTAKGYEVTGGGIQMRNSEIVMPCYGAKITVTQSTSIKGKTYKVGTKLTVDAKMNLTPVSSWD